MRKLILFLICTLIFVSSVEGVKIEQTFSGTNGLDIQVPVNNYIIQNDQIKSNIHVFNLSDGWLMTNETTSCQLHVYNISGEHLLFEDMLFSDEDNDFYVNISSSNFSETGFRSFIIQCNTSDYGGFVTGSIQVTEDGREKKSILDTVLVLILIGSLFIIFGLINFLMSRGKKQ